MADFDLTQTDAQVQSVLNDAQDAQGAGAQTTLNTEYIMLKGTNGRYHKILKDSFTEAVRNVLAGLLVNNDKGTTISQIPAISSGDFGSITPANLASVLGVFKYVNAITDDVLNCRNHGTYIVTKDAANRPTKGNAFYYIMTFKAHIGSEMPCIAIDSTFSSMYFGGIRTDTVIWHKVALEQ